MSLVNRMKLQVFFLTALCASLVVIGLYFDLSKSEWAAWVQSVGSIAAIGLAFHLGRLEHARAVKAAEEAIHGHQECVFSLLWCARENFRECLEAYSHGIGWTKDHMIIFSKITASRIAIEAYQLSGIGSPQIVIGVLKATAALRSMESTLERSSQLVGNGPVMETRLGDIDDALTAAIEGVRRVMTRPPPSELLA